MRIVFVTIVSSLLSLLTQQQALATVTEGVKYFTGSSESWNDKSSAESQIGVCKRDFKNDSVQLNCILKIVGTKLTSKFSCQIVKRAPEQWSFHLDLQTGSVDIPVKETKEVDGMRFEGALPTTTNSVVKVVLLIKENSSEVQYFTNHNPEKKLRRFILKLSAVTAERANALEQIKEL